MALILDCSIVGNIRFCYRRIIIDKQNESIILRQDIIMNEMTMIVIKQALDKIDTRLYKELPLAYADKAMQIIIETMKETAKNIGEMIGIKE